MHPTDPSRLPEPIHLSDEPYENEPYEDALYKDALCENAPSAEPGSGAHGPSEGGAALAEILASASEIPAEKRSLCLRPLLLGKRVPHAARIVSITLAALLLVLGALAAKLWLDRPSGIHHYLLAGKDHWGETDPDDAGRTDVMLLLSLNYDQPSISMTSFLRDTQVETPKGGQIKLNTLARQYGDEGLRTYLEETYSIDIEGLFSINFTGIVQVLDSLGGVTVELTRAEVGYLRRAVGEYEGYPLQEGPCLLNGALALGYMRCRKLDNDFGRTNRQANVLSALMSEARTMQMGEVLGIVPAIARCYTTGMSLGDQLALARGAFSLRSAPLRRHQIPAEGTYRFATVDGASMLRINLEKNRQLFHDFLAGTVE